MSLGVGMQPATQIITVTPSDTTVLNNIRMLLVTAAGDLSIVARHDPVTNVFTFPVALGEVVPVAPSRVMAATTATVIGLI